MTLTITESVASSLIILMMFLLGTFHNSAELQQFAFGIAAVDAPVWHWWYLAVIIPGLALINYVALTIITVLSVWLFNIASALSGGVLVQLEIVDDPR